MSLWLFSGMRKTGMFWIYLICNRIGCAFNYLMELVSRYIPWVNHYDLGCVLEINVFNSYQLWCGTAECDQLKDSVASPLFPPFSSSTSSSSSSTSSSSSFCSSSFFYFFFDNPLKNVKAILSPLAIHT